MPVASDQVWIRSRLTSNLTVEFEQRRRTASHSLRRAFANLCLSIPGQGQVELCKALSMPKDEVLEVVKRSPQVQKFLRDGRIMLIHE